jgi:hypothetical protein
VHVTVMVYCGSGTSGNRKYVDNGLLCIIVSIASRPPAKGATYNAPKYRNEGGI